VAQLGAFPRRSRGASIVAQRSAIFTFVGDKVTRIDVIGDASRLREWEIVAL
jgi:hypothetical protein